MCRWLTYTGRPILMSDLVLESNNSLVHQTLNISGFQPQQHVTRHPVDGDGFGLGWYDHSISAEPARLVFADPAWNNPNLENLSHLLRTQLMFAHVRAATLRSAVSRENCHPFKFGNLLFMHNGGLGGFPLIRRTLLNSLPDPIFNCIHGTTDSEHCFALFLSLLPTLETPIPSTVLRDTMAKLVAILMKWSSEAKIMERSSLNFAVTDGHSLVATRFCNWRYPDHQVAQSLYYSVAGGFERGPDGNLHHCEIEGDKPGAVIISSEPLTADFANPDECPEWGPVPEDSIVTVTPEFQVSIDNLEVPNRPSPPPIATDAVL